MKPLTARQVPLCAVETCQKPLFLGHMLFVRLEGTLRKVCRDCAATLGRKK